MMSRALSLAAASLFCCLAASPGLAQQNLDAGKSPAQIFSGNCGACHRSARGLLKTVSPSSLPDFLRQHYTTGGEMAQMLSGYLTSNRAGAAEPDAGGRRGRSQGANLRSDAPIGGAPDGAAGQPERKPRAAIAKPDEVGIEQAPTPGAKTRQSKRGRRGEPPAASPSAPDVAAKPDGAPAKEAAPVKDTERSIDARVPVPEPVDLPPPTAADIKPSDVKPAEAKPAPAAVAAERPADKPSPERASEAPHAAPSPAEAAVSPGGPPTPPISR